MNFLLRTAQPAAQDNPSVNEPSMESHAGPKAKNTLEGLIAKDPFPQSEDGDGVEGQSNVTVDTSKEHPVPIYGNHSEVAEDEGWITIPYKELPDNWSEASDILSFRSLDRSFVFPGEQVHVLACLSSSKQETEIITPFKVAAVMSKNGILGCKQQNDNKEIESNSEQEGGEENISHQGAAAKSTEQNAETMLNKKIDKQVDISAGESLLRMEDHRKQTEMQLARFKNSHFFVRIAESDEPLWSKRSVQEPFSATTDQFGDKLSTAGARKTSGNDTNHSLYIDRGSFDANMSGGVARNAVRCCSLSNGDLVVLLQVNVGINLLKDPILEILQFEKYQDTNLSSEKADDLIYASQKDPCGDLLKWLLPLDHTLPPPARSLSPPPLSSSGIANLSHKSSFSSSTGSQLFSFGHFRSYSMSSFPPNTTPPPVTNTGSKPISDLEDWDHFSLQKPLKSQESANAGLQSFRGVSLEPERFSVHCGLEGIYIPGKRWRKKLEIIQPVEIHSFAAECDTEDLISVQIKNVSRPHVPDIVIYLDAITIIFEEAPRGGPPVSLPISCIEAGNDCSLPNLALRRNEEHSFILRPASSMWRTFKAQSEKSFRPSPSQSGGTLPNLHLPKSGEGRGFSGSDQYAVLVSCRCNYTESRLFFKQPISWRPRVARDLMISVASEMSQQSCASSGLTQLPVQVLTLQVSNLTTEDLTMTVLAPASVTSLPSVVSLNSAPSTPMSPFVGFSEFAGVLSRERRSNGVQRLSSVPLVSDNLKEKIDAGARSVSLNEETVSLSDVIPSNGLGCTHLWLQSTVPLGCVPSQSTATVKLELLPLTDGIITLDTLQISVKEKGMTYIPEHSLKINATSSIATGIM